MPTLRLGSLSKQIVKPFHQDILLSFNVGVYLFTLQYYYYSLKCTSVFFISVFLRNGVERQRKVKIIVTPNLDKIFSPVNSASGCCNAFVLKKRVTSAHPLYLYCRPFLRRCEHNTSPKIVSTRQHIHIFKYQILFSYKTRSCTAKRCIILSSIPGWYRIRDL